MNKIKIIFVAAIFCAAAFVGYTAYQQATMTPQERLIQANIEALSHTECISSSAGNRGRCKAKTDGTGDVCVVTSWLSIKNCI